MKYYILYAGGRLDDFESEEEVLKFVEEHIYDVDIVSVIKGEELKIEKRFFLSVKGD